MNPPNHETSARPEDRGMQDASPRNATGGPLVPERSGAGGMGWLILAPILCCGGPFIFIGIAAVGARIGGALGLVLALVAGMVVVMRRRRKRTCCAPGATGVSANLGAPGPGIRSERGPTRKAPPGSP
ncbi:MAG: hypothetical protein ACYCS7_04870 [Acidimicrobiales bacterium]